MKYLVQTLILSIVGCNLFIACSKDTDNTTANDTDDISTYIATTTTSSKRGIINEMDNSISIASEVEFNNLKYSGIDTIFSNDSTIVISSSNDDNYNFNYELDANYGIIKKSGPSYSFYYIGDLSCTFAGSNIDSHESRVSEWTLSGLESTSDTYILNGDISSYYNNETATYYSIINMSDITFDKSTSKILSGKMTWEIEQILSESDTIFTATLVFNGDQTADLDLNNISYSMDLETGEFK